MVSTATNANLPRVVVVRRCDLFWESVCLSLQGGAALFMSPHNKNWREFGGRHGVWMQKGWGVARVNIGSGHLFDHSKTFAHAATPDHFTHSLKHISENVQKQKHVEMSQHASGIKGGSLSCWIGFDQMLSPWLVWLWTFLTVGVSVPADVQLQASYIWGGGSFWRTSWGVSVSWRSGGEWVNRQSQGSGASSAMSLTMRWKWKSRGNKKDFEPTTCCSQGQRYLLDNNGSRVNGDFLSLTYPRWNPRNRLCVGPPPRKRCSSCRGG